MNRRGFLAAALSVAAVDRGAPFAAVLDRILGRRHGVIARADHPDPRPGITGERVLNTEAIRAKPRIAEIYDMAREIPQVFDGLYCYCHCHDGATGHRSLLACFETDQPTGCYGCGAQARLAHRAFKEGKSLTEIRAACDKKFG